jgi:hypothetical protein
MNSNTRCPSHSSMLWLIKEITSTQNHLQDIESIETIQNSGWYVKTPNTVVVIPSLICVIEKEENWLS